MIYEIKFTKNYKKDYKKIIKRGFDINNLFDVIEKISNGEELEAKHHLHRLKGNYEGCYECHIKPDWVLIYYIDCINKVLYLIRTGSHSDLF